MTWVFGSFAWLFRPNLCEFPEFYRVCWKIWYLCELNPNPARQNFTSRRTCNLTSKITRNVRFAPRFEKGQKTCNLTSLLSAKHSSKLRVEQELQWYDDKFVVAVWMKPSAELLRVPEPGRQMSIRLVLVSSMQQRIMISIRTTPSLHWHNHGTLWAKIADLK